MAVMGGFETLIMRMSDYLIREGHSVFLICEGVDVRLRAEFHPQVVIQATGRNFYDLYGRVAFEEFYASVELPQVDLIICIDFRSYILAGLMQAKSSCSGAKMILGLFQPDSVQQVKGSNGIALLTRRLLKREAARTSVVAMTKRLQQEWNEEFGRAVSANFIQLPVDLASFQAVKRRPEKYKIVSVGRLNDYKTYNILMIEIVRRLVDEGYDATYHIYGEGPYHEKIEAEVHKYSLEDRVHLHGHLNYEKFPGVLRDAYAFVGMGTAAIEAASAGVPVVYSPPRDMEGVTHGLLHQFDLTELGGFAQDTNPQRRVYDVLKNLVKLEVEEYQLECLKSSEAMKMYSMDSVMTEYDRFYPVKSALGCAPARKNSAFRLWCDYVMLLRRVRYCFRLVGGSSK